MRDHAILALVGGGGRDHDHLALRLRQPAVLLHQRIVIGEEGAEFVRPVREHEEDVGDEARLLLHRFDPRADVGGQALQRRHGKTADRGLGASFALVFVLGIGSLGLSSRAPTIARAQRAERHNALPPPLRGRVGERGRTKPTFLQPARCACGRWSAPVVIELRWGSVLGEQMARRVFFSFHFANDFWRNSAGAQHERP